MYLVKKNCAMWQVILKCSNVIQFSSLSRKRCIEWIASNTTGDGKNE